MPAMQCRMSIGRQQSLSLAFSRTPIVCFLAHYIFGHQSAQGSF
jgi:hypothetical protein